MRIFIRFILFVFFLGIIYNCSHDIHVPSAKKPVRDFSFISYGIYYEGLQYIDPSMSTNPVPEQLKEHLNSNKRLVEDYALEEKIDTQNIALNLKYWLIRKIYLENLEDTLHPDMDTIKKIYKEHSDQFKRKDTIEAGRFLIEYGEGAEEVAAQWKKKLQETYQSNPEEFSFNEISRDYYHSQGVRSDGFLGRIERGRIREELFDLFFEADPEKPYFGPVETQHGYLFGKLYRKWEEGIRDFEEVRPRLEQQIFQNRMQEVFHQLLIQAEEKHHVQYLYPENETSGHTDLSQKVLEIDGTVFTREDLISMIPDMHDHSLKDLAEHFAVRYALYHSDEGQEIQDTEDFSLIIETLLDEYRVQQFLKGIYEEEITIAEEDLYPFYLAIKEQFYPGYDLYKIRLFDIPWNPEGKTDRLAVHESRKEAWKNINHIREYFLEQEDKIHTDLSHFEEEKRLKVHELDEWTSVVQLGGLIGRDIAGRRAGETSPVIIGRNNYLFYYIVDYQEGEVRPFDEVKDRVRVHYTLYQQQKIRQRYGIHYASDAPQEFMEKVEEQLTGNL